MKFRTATRRVLHQKGNDSGDVAASAVISNEYEKSMFRLEGEISLFSCAFADLTTRSLTFVRDDILYSFETM